jgi:S1-C subfamily serine protease
VSGYFETCRVGRARPTRNAGRRAPPVLNVESWWGSLRSTHPAHLLAIVLIVLIAVGAVPSVAAASSPRASLAEAIAAAQAKVVKVYGAGGFRGMESYQSGILISRQGHILTLWSHVLDTDHITVTLGDGRRLEAKLLGADPRLDTAILKIEGADFPYFDLAKAVRLEAGTPVLAMSNVFSVAMGDEAVSVQRGNVSVVSRLEARRGTFETPYHGRVYVLDCTTNNPGAAGGALVTCRGELAAMLGRELRNSLNNTWLNYALPIDELRGSIDAIRAGKFVATPEQAPEKPAHPLRLAALGIVLVPDVLERTPPFVDQVRPGTAAARAGMLPDDLILLVGNRLVQSCKALEKELATIDRASPVTLTVLRQQDLVEVTLRAE